MALSGGPTNRIAGTTAVQGYYICIYAHTLQDDALFPPRTARCCPSADPTTLGGNGNLQIGRGCKGKALYIPNGKAAPPHSRACDHLQQLDTIIIKRGCRGL